MAYLVLAKIFLESSIEVDIYFQLVIDSRYLFCTLRSADVTKDALEMFTLYIEAIAKVYSSIQYTILLLSWLQLCNISLTLYNKPFSKVTV